MSKDAIRLSIQEIVSDFEKMTRIDERISLLGDLGKLDMSDCTDYHNEMQGLAEKYMPKYPNLVSSDYFSDDAYALLKGSILYDMLHENFKQIFYKLV